MKSLALMALVVIAVVFIFPVVAAGIPNNMPSEEPLNDIRMSFTTMNRTAAEISAILNGLSETVNKNFSDVESSRGTIQNNLIDFRDEIDNSSAIDASCEEILEPRSRQEGGEVSYRYVTGVHMLSVAKNGAFVRNTCINTGEKEAGINYTFINQTEDINFFTVINPRRFHQVIASSYLRGDLVMSIETDSPNIQCTTEFYSDGVLNYTYLRNDYMTFKKIGDGDWIRIL